MAGYRLEYDHDWELEVASDGRKRRSFLPAPKKGSGASPTSPQASGNPAFFHQPQQQQHHGIPTFPPPPPSHHQHHQQYRQDQSQQYYHQQQHQQQQQQQYFQQQQYQSQSPYGQQQYQRHHFQRQQQQQLQQQPQQQPQQHQQSPAQQQLQQHQQQHYQPQQQPQHHQQHHQHPQIHYHSGNEIGRGRRVSASDSPHRRSSSGSPHPDFGQGIRVGSRIKIGGVKSGIVRYVGTIHLAPGIFCGVELLDADGTHDGEVNGHRYFNCPPKHGIFAPKNKVCLDPAYVTSKLISSDSDPCYSSNESLAEKSNQALRKYAEGELEAVDCSKISPTVSKDFRTIQHDDDDDASHAPAYKGGLGRSDEKRREVNLNSTYNLDDSKGSSSPHSRSFDDLPDPDLIQNLRQQPRSVLPRPRSSLPAPTSSSSAAQSKLPTFSKSFVKSSEVVTCPQDQLPPFQSDGGRPQFDANQTYTFSPSDITTAISVTGGGVSSGDSLEHRASSGSRSSEDSEEDGVSKDRLSSGVKDQLLGDSRQYLNFTFDKDLRDSLDHDESGSDTNAKDTNPFGQFKPQDGKRSVSPDSYNLVTESSSHSILSSEVLADNSLTDCHFPTEFLQGKRDKKSDRRRTSTPIDRHSRHSPVGSRSYVVRKGEGYLRQDVANHNAPVDDDDRHLSHPTSRSVSDVDLGTDVDIVSAASSDAPWNRQGQGQMLTEGGYLSNVVLDGDGNSATSLSFPPPSETLSRNLSSDNHPSVAQGQGVATTKDQQHHHFPPQQKAPLSSESYTVSRHPPTQGEAEAKSGRSHSLPPAASRSYTVTTAPKAAEQNYSAVSDKVRHSSTGSSANGGDNSSSSGTDPKTESSEEGKGEHVDDSSNGVSPEVSQTLEWDYGQDFDGKIPLHGSGENTMSGSASTGTSESLSDVLRDVSEHSDIIEPELASGATEDSEDQFETPDNDFENIDSLEDFPIFGKDPKAIMTDSGISDKDFEYNMAKSSSTICGNSSDECSREDDASLATTKAAGSDSSQETIAAELIADTPVSVEEKGFPVDNSNNPLDAEDLSQVDSTGDGGYSNSPGSVISVVEVADVCDKRDAAMVMATGPEVRKDQFGTLDARPGSDASMSGLRQDVLGELDAAEVKNGGRKERPISLLSTTSADTGYAPDTDSEIGTLTTNTPSEWVDKQGVTHPTSYAPLEEYYDLSSPVDGEDFLKKESLALSRALRQQNSTQSTASNVSDAEEVLEVPGRDTRSSKEEAELVDESNDRTLTLDKTAQGFLEEPETVEDTEDDRIEADQAHGPPGSSSNSSHVSTRENTPPGLTPEAGEKSSGGAGDTVVVVSGDGAVDKDSDTTFKTDSGSVISEGQPISATPKIDESDDKKPRTRKALVMTKKKMEVIDHKLPNKKVASKLADYIKAPTPVKPKEDNKEAEESKISKNIRIISGGNKKKANNRAPSADRSESNLVNANDEESNENEKNRRKSEKFEKPKPPAIKRTTPKSKWGNIMSQIEAGKDTVKPKPKSEIKSSLAAYLNAPSPAPPPPGSTDAVVNTLNGEADPPPPPPHPPKKEFKSRHKPLPPPPPKIDLSKIKSKLGVPTAASASKRTTKRDPSPASASSAAGPNRGPPPPRSAATSRDSSPAAPNRPVTRSMTDRGRSSEGNIVLIRQPQQPASGSTSATNASESLRSSRTDLASLSVDNESLADEGTSSKGTSIAENGTSKKDRRHSVNSVKSSLSEKAKLRNGDVENSSRRTRAATKSSRISNSPARVAPRTIEIRLDSSSPGGGTSRRTSGASPTPVIVKAVAKPRSTSRGGSETGRSPGGTGNGGRRNKSPDRPSSNKGRNSVYSSKCRCCARWLVFFPSDLPFVVPAWYIACLQLLVRDNSPFSVPSL